MGHGKVIAICLNETVMGKAKIEFSMTYTVHVYKILNTSLHLHVNVDFMSGTHIVYINILTYTCTY